MKGKPLISYIIPVFQAESFIFDNLRHFSKYCNDSDLNSEIIVVNDGSTDRTNEIIISYIKNNSLIKYINLPQNRGKGFAVKKGLEAADGQYIVFTDCDLPYSFRNIKDAVYHLVNNKANVVIADRMHKDSVYTMRSENLSYIYLRHTAGRVYNRLINFFTGLNIEDTQAGLKGFDRGTAELVLKKMTVKGFSFDIDLLMCAKEQRKKIIAIPVEHNYNSEMSTVRFMKNTFIMFFDLLHIFFKQVTGYYRK